MLPAHVWPRCPAFRPCCSKTQFREGVGFSSTDSFLSRALQGGEAIQLDICWEVELGEVNRWFPSVHEAPLVSRRRRGKESRLGGIALLRWRGRQPNLNLCCCQVLQRRGGELLNREQKERR